MDENRLKHTTIEQRKELEALLDALNEIFSNRHFSNSPNSNFLKTKANSLALCS